MCFFRPKEGKFEKLDRQSLEKMIKTDKLSKIGKYGPSKIEVYADKKFKVYDEDDNNNLLITNKKFKFFYKDSDYARIIVIPNNSKVAYYSNQEKEEKASKQGSSKSDGSSYKGYPTISTKEFNNFCNEKGIGQATIGPVKIASWPNFINGISVNQNGNKFNATISGHKFKDIDANVVKGILLVEDKVYIVVK